METVFARLTLNKEEEAVLQVKIDPNTEKKERGFRLVGYFLTASIIHFQVKWGENLLKIPLILTSFWVQIHDVPTGFFSEILAKKLGDFIGHSDSFCEAKMALSVEIAVMGWDLSLRP
ncbi:hypothetical protein J1N35_044655 [Gossypium stocksii]|uniref:DUF4283 domain-containing protein n=1 Tax=Gossypium stocksii TaxID=47602 RepID=A0A9D3ZGB2_9ROSI|nr:hypothetical protein J1N35_044655 [Gossypium stocksii]